MRVQRMEPALAFWTEQVGFTVHDLIRMLKSGMSLECLLDLIEVRTTGICGYPNRVPRN